MIVFKNISKLEPFKILHEKYEKAISNKQDSPEIISIASFDTKKNEVNSRYVNLKIIDNEEFIFFTNYNSTKSNEFQLHKQISALIYWEAINVQIRMKAKILKTSSEFNRRYFLTRSPEKNALAISSNQSNIIDSFETVERKYKKTLSEESLTKCPEYWGGFSFFPFEIEFWEGNRFRINKRELYIEEEGWKKFILEP